MNAFRKYITKEFGVKCINLLKGYNVNDHYNLYLSSLSWSRDKMIAYQIDRIKEILKYSYENSNFYKKRIDECGLNLENFKYSDQLKNMAPLTRNELKNKLNEIVSKEFDLSKCSKSSSSGSTGSPAIFYHDKNGIAANRASMLFIKFLGGFEPGNKWINIWGNPTAVNVDWKKPSNRYKKYFLNEIRFPAFTLNQKNQFNVLYKLFKEKKPAFVHGYTNAIFLFSKYLEERNENITYIKGVFTTAENLHDYQRKTIQKYLGHVYDHYSCTETNGIAAQTKFDKYYSVLDPHVYIEFGEIVDTKTNLRKIILTDLDNRVLPFIRYETGDLSVPLKDNEAQTSTLNFSKFTSLDGRVSDIITLPNGGNLVVPTFLGARVLRDIEGIKQYQVQMMRNKIILNLIIDRNFKTESKKKILNTLDDYIPSEVMYELVFNREIIYSSNGKFKLLVDNSSN
jgi:phenylacetate-CoA ligase